MKLDLLTFHSQPQLNRMVLSSSRKKNRSFTFVRSFWEYLFSVRESVEKRRKYQTRKVLMLECCLVVFCIFSDIMCTPIQSIIHSTILQEITSKNIFGIVLHLEGKWIDAERKKNFCFVEGWLARKC